MRRLTGCIGVAALLILQCWTLASCRVRQGASFFDPFTTGRNSFEGCKAPQLDLSTTHEHVAATSAAQESSLVQQAPAVVTKCNTLTHVELVQLRYSSAPSITCCPIDSLECGGCAAFNSATQRCSACLPGFVRQCRSWDPTCATPLCTLCSDLPLFEDRAGRTCASACPASSAGTLLSDAQRAAFRRDSKGGVSVLEACCGCGGGDKQPTPFSFQHSTNSVLLGQRVRMFPYPRTATRYAVDEKCQLQTVGLSVNATTGAIDGTPTATSPFDVDCTVFAVQDLDQGLTHNTTVKLVVSGISYGTDRLVAFDNRNPNRTVAQTASRVYSSYSMVCVPTLPWLSINAANGLLTATPGSFNGMGKVVAEFDPLEPLLYGAEKSAGGSALLVADSYRSEADKRREAIRRGGAKQESEKKAEEQEQKDEKSQQSAGGGKPGELLTGDDLVTEEWTSGVCVVNATQAGGTADGVAFWAVAAEPWGGINYDLPRNSLDLTVGQAVPNAGTAPIPYHPGATNQFDASRQSKRIPPLYFTPVCVANHEATLTATGLQDTTTTSHDPATGQVRHRASGVALFTLDPLTGKIGGITESGPGKLPMQFDSRRGRMVFRLRCHVWGKVLSADPESATQGAQTWIRTDTPFSVTVLDDTCWSHARLPFIGVSELTTTGAPYRPEYLGCYEDNQARDLNIGGQMDVSPHRDPVTACAVHCGSRGATHFGLQNGRQCWCGSRAPLLAKRSESECNMPCDSNTDVMCGAAWRNSVYTLPTDIARNEDECRNSCKALPDCGAFAFTSARRCWRLRRYLGRGEPSQWMTTRLTSDFPGQMPRFEFGWLRVSDCSAQNTCLVIRVPNQGWMSGRYCPAVRDTLADEYAVLYAKETADPNNKIFLQRFIPSREAPATVSLCPANTTWVIRQADSTDLVIPPGDKRVPPGSPRVAEVKGPLLACIRSLEAPDTINGVRVLAADGVAASDVAQNSGRFEVDLQLRLNSEACPNPYALLKEAEEEQKAAERGGDKDAKKDRELKGKGKNGDKAEEVSGTPITQIITFESEGAAFAAGNPEFSLHPCECFSRQWGLNPPVTPDQFKLLPPTGDNRISRPQGILIAKGRATCASDNILTSFLGVRDVNECRDKCEANKRCALYQFSKQEDATTCRLFTGCPWLFSETATKEMGEVESELYGFPRDPVCVIADPQKCLEYSKRREYYTGSDDGLNFELSFERLLMQCDHKMLSGDTSLVGCGKPLYAPVTSMRRRRFAPEAFPSGSQLTVGCWGERYVPVDKYRGGLNFMLSNATAAPQPFTITCIDGRWVDRYGGEGLKNFECASCVQVAQPELKTSRLQGRDETYFTRSLAVQVRLGVNDRSELCLGHSRGTGRLMLIECSNPVANTQTQLIASDPNWSDLWLSPFAPTSDGTSQVMLATEDGKCLRFSSGHALGPYVAQCDPDKGGQLLDLPQLALDMNSDIAGEGGSVPEFIERNNGWNELAYRENFFLDRQTVSCGENEVFASFVLASAGASTPAETNFGGWLSSTPQTAIGANVPDLAAVTLTGAQMGGTWLGNLAATGIFPMSGNSRRFIVMVWDGTQFSKMVLVELALNSDGTVQATAVSAGYCNGNQSGSAAAANTCWAGRTNAPLSTGGEGYGVSGLRMSASLSSFRFQCVSLPDFTGSLAVYPPLQELRTGCIGEWNSFSVRSFNKDNSPSCPAGASLSYWLASYAGDCPTNSGRFTIRCRPNTVSDSCVTLTSREVPTSDFARTLAGVRAQCGVGQALQAWWMETDQDVSRTVLRYTCCDLRVRQAPESVLSASSTNWNDFPLMTDARQPDAGFLDRHNAECPEQGGVMTRLLFQFGTNGQRQARLQWDCMLSRYSSRRRFESECTPVLGQPLMRIDRGSATCPPSSFLSSWRVQRSNCVSAGGVNMLFSYECSSSHSSQAVTGSNVCRNLQTKRLPLIGRTSAFEAKCAAGEGLTRIRWRSSWRQWRMWLEYTCCGGLETPAMFPMSLAMTTPSSSSVQGGKVSVLDNFSVGCPRYSTALRYFRMLQTPGTDRFQYAFACSFLPGAYGGDMQYETDCLNLDRFGVDVLTNYYVRCPAGTALYSWRLSRSTCGTTAGRYKMVYGCRQSMSLGQSQVIVTKAEEIGTTSTLDVLTRPASRVDCPVGSVLTAFHPTWIAGATEFGYEFQCTKIGPLAVSIAPVGRLPPVELQKSPVIRDLSLVEPWEGLYCPVRQDDLDRVSYTQRSSFQGAGRRGWGGPDTGASLLEVSETSFSKQTQLPAPRTLSWNKFTAEWCLASGTTANAVGPCMQSDVLLPTQIDSPNSPFFVSPVTDMLGTYADPEGGGAAGGKGGGAKLLLGQGMGEAAETSHALQMTNDEHLESAAIDAEVRLHGSTGGISLLGQTPGPTDPPKPVPGVAPKNEDLEEVKLKDLYREECKEPYPDNDCFETEEAKNAAGFRKCFNDLRDKQMQVAKLDRDNDITQASLDLITGAVSAACGAIPDPDVAPMGVGARLPPKDVCLGISDLVNAQGHAQSTTIFRRNVAKLEDAMTNGCDPIEMFTRNTFCGLRCIEDEVRKGDEALVSVVKDVFTKSTEHSKKLIEFYRDEMYKTTGWLSDLLARQSKLDAAGTMLRGEVTKLSDSVRGRINTQSDAIDAKVQTKIKLAQTDDASVPAKRLAAATASVDALTSSLDSQLGRVAPLVASLRQTVASPAHRYSVHDRPALPLTRDRTKLIVSRLTEVQSAVRAALTTTVEEVHAIADKAVGAGGDDLAGVVEKAVQRVEAVRDTLVDRVARDLDVAVSLLHEVVSQQETDRVAHASDPRIDAIYSDYQQALAEVTAVHSSHAEFHTALTAKLAAAKTSLADHRSSMADLWAADSEAAGGVAAAADLWHTGIGAAVELEGSLHHSTPIALLKETGEATAERQHAIASLDSVRALVDSVATALDAQHVGFENALAALERHHRAEETVSAAVNAYVGCQGGWEKTDAEMSVLPAKKLALTPGWEGVKFAKAAAEDSRVAALTEAASSFRTGLGALKTIATAAATGGLIERLAALDVLRFANFAASRPTDVASTLFKDAAKSTDVGCAALLTSDGLSRMQALLADALAHQRSGVPTLSHQVTELVRQLGAAKLWIETLAAPYKGGRKALPEGLVLATLLPSSDELTSFSRLTSLLNTRLATFSSRLSNPGPHGSPLARAMLQTFVRHVLPAVCPVPQHCQLVPRTADASVSPHVHTAVPMRVHLRSAARATDESEPSTTSQSAQSPSGQQLVALTSRSADGSVLLTGRVEALLSGKSANWVLDGRTHNSDGLFVCHSDGRVAPALDARVCSGPAWNGDVQRCTEAGGKRVGLVAVIDTSAAHSLPIQVKANL